MSNDIVTRLRALTEVGSWVALGEWDSVTKEAADEIERLRADRDEWRKMALAEHWLRVQGHLGCDCLDRAVRGE